MNKKPSYVVPVLVGGVFLGVSSALPVINFLNCGCCMLVVGGGLLASYIYLREYPQGLPPVTYGDGALLGLLSGFVGSVAYMLVNIPVTLVGLHLGLGALDMEEIREALSDPNIPPVLHDILEMVLAGEGLSLFAMAMTFLLALPIFSIFALVGGVLGVALFQKRGAPPLAPPPSTLPPSPPPEAPGSGTLPR